jgi:hypothetical protein
VCECRAAATNFGLMLAFSFQPFENSQKVEASLQDVIAFNDGSS